MEEIIKFINNTKEEDINKLCLKIHILGSGPKKQYILNNMFKEEVSDNNLRNKFKVTKQFKTEQFHWIAHVYENDLLNKDIFKEIEKEITEDRKEKNGEKIILKNQVILCFGNENTELVSSQKFRKSNIIFITETECKLDKKMDKRYASNIIYKNMSDENLNIKLISLLWELDCYFKEKGNIVCRYTPDSIFNGLEYDNSLFTLNILMTGLSRVGKSTFINLMTRKLSALESDLAESVTKNISEYYIYNKDNKKKHGAIKLIDTPGLVVNKANGDYADKEKQIKELIMNKGKTFGNRIHFIFFILTKSSKLNFDEAKNIKEVFKLLNECDCPVFFIINKIKKKANSEKIISSLREVLNQNGFNKLSNKNNFIVANFLKGEEGEAYGIHQIFSKISEYIYNNNYLDEKILSNMEGLIKDYRAEVESHSSFLSLKNDDNLTNKELKDNIKFSQRLEEIKTSIKNNKLFSDINLDSLISNAEISAKECLKVIMSLSKLNGVLPNISQNLPAISIYQAFMVKEIGARFGFDIDIVNIGTKQLLQFINKLLPIKEKTKPNYKIEGVEEVNIEEFQNVIQQKAKERLSDSTNEKATIFSLADLLSRIMKISSQKEKIDNTEFSIAVYKYCIKFFEKELRDSEGLFFILNCFNKYKLLMEDIKDYIKKEDWDNYEVKIET